MWGMRQWVVTLPIMIAMRTGRLRKYILYIHVHINTYICVYTKQCAQGGEDP